MPLHEYRILEKMAVGSFGMVFRIQRILDDAILVMKRIPLEDLDADQRHEAAQEMCLMTELHHPYIVCQRDAFLFNENDLCLIMDYYDGGDLEPFVMEQREKDEYFPFQRVMLWFTQMLLATDYLHTHGIVHRDLKTRNLFVDRRTNSIAVGDFGIAEKIDTSKIATWRNLNNTRSQRLSSGQIEVGTHSPPPSAVRRWSSASIPTGPSPNQILRGNGAAGEMDAESSFSHSYMRGTPTGSPIHYDRPVVSNQSPLNPFYLQSPEQLNQAMRGTPLYMAPEALQGGHVGPKADVWSLGCILYELLALRHPFETRDIGGLVMRVTQGMREPLPAHYPAAVHTLMDVMLSVDARGRPSCAAILESPLLKAYVELLQILRVPGDTPQDPTEISLANQLRVLKATLDPSAKHAFARAAEGHATLAGMEGGEDTDPRVLAYTKVELSLAPPLNPPSVEHKLARQRQAEMAAGAGTMYASGSAESSVSSSAFPMGAGTFFTAGVPPLLATPSPEHPSRSVSRLSADPSSGGGGSGGSAGANFPVMAPTASMRPFMIYDNTTEHHAGRQSTSASALSVSAAAAAAAAAVTSQSPLTPPSVSRSRPWAKDLQPNEDADRFYAEYANVVDMRDKETMVIAAEVTALREAVQTMMRRKKQHMDGAELQRRHGTEVTNSMPGTTGTTTTATATTMTTATNSTAGSPSGTRVVDGTRVYYNNLYSCLLHQQQPTSSSTQPGSWPWRLDGVPRAGLGLLACQFHDSMPVSSSSPSVTPAPVPATSDGVHGRGQTPSSARSKRLGASPAVDGRPAVPRGDRPASGYLRRALFAKDSAMNSLTSGPPSGTDALVPHTPPPPSGAPCLNVPNLLVGPPVLTAEGLMTSTTPLHELPIPQAYATRRMALVKRVAAELDGPVWQAIYWYYRDTSLVQRDPRTVLGWVPDRNRWKVLPLVEELVVLDRFLVNEKTT